MSTMSIEHIMHLIMLFAILGFRNAIWFHSVFELREFVFLKIWNSGFGFFIVRLGLGNSSQIEDGEAQIVNLRVEFVNIIILLISSMFFCSTVEKSLKVVESRWKC